MIAVSMPPGVEHLGFLVENGIILGVIAVSMPPGVEHYNAFADELEKIA